MKNKELCELFKIEPKEKKCIGSSDFNFIQKKHAEIKKILDEKDNYRIKHELIESIFDNKPYYETKVSIYLDFELPENKILLINLLSENEFPITFQSAKDVYVTGHSCDLVCDCYNESTDFWGDSLTDAVINFINLKYGDETLTKDMCYYRNSFDEMCKDIENLKLEAQKVAWVWS
jgi:hypothetical protein